MADLDIKKYGSEVLRQEAQTVDGITDEVQQLAEDMIKAMYNGDGIGLAAPQIGISKRVIVFDVNPEDPSSKPVALINPEIIEKEGAIGADEGCLSLPEIRGEVERAQKIKIEALSLDGEEVCFEATDIMARVIQHEIDHLDGILFIDHLGRIKRQLIKKQLRKLEETTKRGK